MGIKLFCLLLESFTTITKCTIQEFPSSKMIHHKLSPKVFRTALAENKERYYSFLFRGLPRASPGNIHFYLNFSYNKLQPCWAFLSQYSNPHTSKVKMKVHKTTLSKWETSATHTCKNYSPSSHYELCSCFFKEH